MMSAYQMSACQTGQQYLHFSRHVKIYFEELSTLFENAENGWNTLLFPPN